MYNNNPEKTRLDAEKWKMFVLLDMYKKEKQKLKKDIGLALKEGSEILYQVQGE